MNVPMLVDPVQKSELTSKFPSLSCNAAGVSTSAGKNNRWRLLAGGMYGELKA